MSSGWKAGDLKTIFLKMSLDKNYFLNGMLRHLETFSLWTAISIDNNGNKQYITEATRFISNRSGNWKAQVAHKWPTIVAMFILIVALLSVCYVAYKKGLCKKGKEEKELIRVEQPRPRRIPIQILYKLKKIIKF